MAIKVCCKNMADLIRLQRVAFNNGWVMDFKEVANAWKRYSRTLNEEWIELYKDDRQLWDKLCYFMICESG